MFEELLELRGPLGGNLVRCCLKVKNGFVLNFRIDHGNPFSPNRLYRVVNWIIYMTDIQ